MLDVNMPKNAASVIAVISFIGCVLCRSVRVTELRVPSEAILGASVRLVCSYDLGSEELYVVKWYKDDLEFYRYEPKDLNQSVYFPQPGIDIDLSQSGSNDVFLRNVALDTAGTYKCQVSTEAPTYSCVQAVKEMDVIIKPVGGPNITGGEDGYDFGDNITLNCTSSRSKPAAVLNWLVNGKSVAGAQTTDHGIRVVSDNLQVSSKSLRLQVTEALFQSGKLSINCEANFYGSIAVTGKEFTLLVTETDEASYCKSGMQFLLLLLVLLTLWSTER